MGEKFATLILKVDLECCQCYKKIRKVLCKLQDREKIRSITYDEKNNVVIISGPFDPHMLSKKLCCKACKVIKDIEIKEAKPEKPKPADPPPPPAEEPKPKPAPPPPEPKPAPPPPEPKPAPPPPEPKPAPPPPEPKPAPPPPEPKPAPPPPGPAPPAPAPKPAPPPPEPAPPKAKPEAWPCEPACACRCCSRPCYVGYYGGCRCSSCGMVFGWSSNEFPPPVLMYGRPTPHCQAPKTCQFFCEEDPSCSIM